MQNLLFLIVLFILNSFLYGIEQKKNFIIMGDDWYLTKTFRDEKGKILDLAQMISNNYDGVVIHLGNKIIFERNGDFFYKSSKENLKLFTDIIKEKHKKVYFWFLDSFGSIEFEDIYKDYFTISKNLKNELQNLGIYYDGIILDLEWINHNTKSVEIDNSEKYIKILSDVKKVFFDKELLNFVSLTDSETENYKRGFNEKLIGNYNPIVMLYIKDGGFFLEDNNPVAYLNSERVNKLRHYFLEKNYKVAISLEKGVLVLKNNTTYFIRNFRIFDNDIDEIYSNLQFLNEKNYDFYSMKKYRVTSDFLLKKNDGDYQELKKDEDIFIYDTNINFLQENDFIWEFFKYNRNY